MNGDGHYAGYRPSSVTISALELCISDERKPLLLSNDVFVPYLVSALLLGLDHPRAGMKDDQKIWCQAYHVECLAQLACSCQAKPVLLQHASVMPALQQVAESGMSAESRQFAQAALLALNETELIAATEGQKHVMLSYSWAHQSTVQRLNDSLIRRGYLTWFDLTNLKGARELRFFVVVRFHHVAEDLIRPVCLVSSWATQAVQWTR